ncbi:MAG: hypothetical protein JWM47_337, partial [Acidimicrobiales bacterium]|nr:hypothetical protein [Acidimicrobiales bacterium]
MSVTRVIGVLSFVASMAMTAGCGNSGSQVETRASGVPSVVGPSGILGSLAVAQSGDRVFVVEGGADREGQAPRPAVTWFPADEPTARERFDLPLDAPLYDVSAWWTGHKLAVIGTACPNWTAVSNPPDIFSDDAAPLAQLCGSDQQIIGTWEPSSNEWREVKGLDVRSTFGIDVVHAVGERALLSVPQAGDSARPSVATTVQRSTLDVGRASMSEGLAVPDLMDTAEATFSTCLSDTEALVGLMVWDGPAPAVLASEGWDVSLAAEVPQPKTGRAQSFMALRSDASGWSPV